MSRTEHVDLDVLARRRTPVTDEVKPPRRWLRFAVPAVLLVIFAAVLATSLEGLLRGAKTVSLVRPEPVVGEGAATAAPGSIVAQAAGWVEPDPFPLEVTALAEGVVRELLVQESDAVEAGDVVARLVDEDARLACARAEAQLARAEADERSARATLEAARAAFDAPTALEEAAAVGEANVVGKRAEAEHREQAVAKGRALLTLAEEELVVQRELGAAGAAGPRQAEIAEARVAEARADLAILEADAALAAAEAQVALAQRERARRDLELRIEDTLRLRNAEAGLELATAEVAVSRVMCDEANLRLERMEVRAPAAGVVLERLATLGTPLMGGASTVVSLYDPTSLRVRVDVPQQDLAKLFVGQEARVDNDARRGRPYRGEVLRIVRRADIQKVTLQAHVRVLDSDELLRPEMLVQVRFLEPEQEVASDAPRIVDASRVAIPSRLLLDGDRVWIVDGETGRAALRDVRVHSREGERAVIAAGLDLSHKLIDEGRDELREGDRLRIED